MTTTTATTSPTNNTIPLTGPILVAEAPPHTPATQVPTRTHKDLSVVAIVAPIGPRAATDLPKDLIAALGIRDDVAGRSRHDQDDTMLLPIWLRAHRTVWVVITSPHSLTLPALQLLPTLTLPAGTRLLLACDHGTGQGVLDRLADWGATRTDWNTLGHVLPEPEPSASPEPTGDDNPWTDRDLTLPREDWPTFRSECRRLLNPVTFAAVDLAYTRAFRASRIWLASNQPTEQATATLIGTILGSTGNLDHAIAALRGCQAAHMEAGWHLRADLGTVIAALSQQPLTFDDDHWRSLRAYRDPHRSAAVTLHHHGLTVTGMHQLTLHAIAADGSRADTLPIDSRGRVYLRAQRLHRLTDGASDTDLLFPDEPRRSIHAIRDAQADLSLRLGTGRMSDNENATDRWQRRLGITLGDLR